MLETPRAFTRRTSIAYASSARAAILAAPLAPDTPCPTLFRYPGPCGLADWFAGDMTRLGPGLLLWLADRPWWRDTFGARFFGTLAVLTPLRFGASPAGPGIYVGDNTPLDPDEVIWVPPVALARPIPWNDLATAASARRHLPADLAGERHRAIDGLSHYLEELDAMRASGAPGPGVPWCQVPRERRLRQLAEHGVRATWSADDASASGCLQSAS
jgi:hypothetical protein